MNGDLVPAGALNGGVVNGGGVLLLGPRDIVAISGPCPGLRLVVKLDYSGKNGVDVAISGAQRVAAAFVSGSDTSATVDGSAIASLIESEVPGVVGCEVAFGPASVSTVDGSVVPAPTSFAGVGGPAYYLVPATVAVLDVRIEP